MNKTQTIEAAKRKALIRLTVGLGIRELREKEKISQESLAKLVGLSRPAIVNIEQGKQNIAIDAIPLFCNALNISITNFCKFLEVD